MDNTILITAHSILRWAVLLFGIYAITKSAQGIFMKQAYTPSHTMAATLLVASVHLQVVIGLLLYIARGWYHSFSTMAETMGNPALRFWAVEHLTGMLIAAIIIQIGRSKSKKAKNPEAKHKIALLFYTIGILLIIAMIPWPFRTEIARSLWP